MDGLEPACRAMLPQHAPALFASHWSMLRQSCSLIGWSSTHVILVFAVLLARCHGTEAVLARLELQVTHRLQADKNSTEMPPRKIITSHQQLSKHLLKRTKKFQNICINPIASEIWTPLYISSGPTPAQSQLSPGYSVSLKQEFRIRSSQVFHQKMP